MADETELGEDDLRLLETSYRFVVDANSFDNFIDSWIERFERAERSGAGPIDNLLINSHLRSLLDILKKTASDETDPQDAVEEVVSVSGAALVLSPSNLVVALNASATREWNVLRGAATSLDWLDPTSRENLDQVRRSSLQRGNLLHSILRTFDEDGSVGLAEVFAIDREEHPGLIAVRSLNFGWTQKISELLIDSFDLTRAETDVCRLLLDLREAEEIATARSTSIRTVRTQLQSIFAKTQTNNQVDLIRLLALMSSHIAKREPSAIAKWEDPLERQSIIKDRDGRDIAFTWMGDPNGRPVLFCHGVATGYLLPSHNIRSLEERGIKAYCISRPCFGDTSPSLRRDFAQAASDDIATLASHLKVTRWIALGLGSGVIPIFRAALSPGSSIAGIVASSTYLPFSSEETLNYLPAARRVSVQFARRSKMLSELAAMVAYRMMRVRGPEFIWQTMYGSCIADQEAARNPDYRALIRTAISFMTAQKHRVFANELRMLSDDWDDDFTQCPVPVHFLHGVEDPAIPIDWVRSKVSGISTMKLTEVDGAGEMLFCYHADKIIDALADMIDAQANDLA